MSAAASAVVRWGHFSAFGLDAREQNRCGLVLAVFPASEFGFGRDQLAAKGFGED